MVFHWGQASSNPSPVEFSANDSSGASTVRVTLQAPGRYLFVLTVENELAMLSLPDSVVVTVRPPNRAPTANAGSDQTVQTGATVQLDGSGSSDPDHDALTYRWTAPPQLTLGDVAAVRPHFIPSVDGTYIITLVVSDGQSSSAPDQVVVVIEGSGFADPTFTQVQRQVLTPSCALSGCHADADHPILSAGQAYGNLVGVASSVGLILVTPGDPDRSYLYIKVTGGPGMVGSRMPRGRGALSD
ncbi:MAG: PKD domain-containing protein, partial [Candidatus Latescibacterota bacterium]